VGIISRVNVKNLEISFMVMTISWCFIIYLIYMTKSIKLPVLILSLSSLLLGVDHLNSELPGILGPEPIINISTSEKIYWIWLLEIIYMIILLGILFLLTPAFLIRSHEDINKICEQMQNHISENDRAKQIRSLFNDIKCVEALLNCKKIDFFIKSRKKHNDEDSSVGDSETENKAEDQDQINQRISSLYGKFKIIKEETFDMYSKFIMVGYALGASLLVLYSLSAIT
jgi:hypothetical protein